MVEIVEKQQLVLDQHFCYLRCTSYHPIRFIGPVVAGQEMDQDTADCPHSHRVRSRSATTLQHLKGGGRRREANRKSEAQ